VIPEGEQSNLRGARHAGELRNEAKLNSPPPNASWRWRTNSKWANDEQQKNQWTVFADTPQKLHELSERAQTTALRSRHGALSLLQVLTLSRKYGNNLLSPSYNVL
jgi:hypothetical protein